MRISDWSSDVCSSDLPDEARARALEAEQQAEKRHSSGNGFMLFFWLAILLFFVAPIMLGGVFGGRRYGRGRGRGPEVIWGPGIGEIGRASGRERVCQYVLISGGAVSLKKKKKT